MSGVIPPFPSRHLAFDFIPMLIFQTSICALAVTKSIQAAAAQYKTPRIMVVLLRDTAMYFGSILLVLIANIVVFTAIRVRASSSAPIGSLSSFFVW